MAASVLLDIIAPILVLIGLGAIMRRKFRIDLDTIGKLNIYLFSPAFVFYHVATSKLTWSAMGGVVTITVVQVVTLGAIVWAVGRLANVPHKTLAAVAMAVMFYNSGNYGLPLAELAFPKESADAIGHNGGAVQVFVMLTQNILGYTLGLTIAAWAGSGDLRRAAGRILHMPVLYVLGVALLARAWTAAGHAIPVMILKPAEYLAQGLIPVALVTLGAQLMVKPRWPRWKPVGAVLVARLLLGPVQMATLLWLFHLTGVPVLDMFTNGTRWPADLLILTAAVPTAVTTLLLTMELGGDTDLAADCVFWTTVVSAVTIAGWLIVIKAW